jgi:hypothetical protein
MRFKMEKTKLLMVVIVGLAVMLGGCAKKVQQTGFLSTYKNLEPISDNTMRYIGPNVGDYSKFGSYPKKLMNIE